MAVVRTALREHGRDIASALSLIRIDDDGSASPIADGDDLIRLVDPIGARSSARHVA